MNKYFILSNGCIRRKKETQILINYFESNGYQHTSDLNSANFIVFISCGFSDNMEILSHEILKTIIKGRNEDARIIIGGCWPKITDYLAIRQQNVYLLDLKNYSAIEEIVPPRKVIFKNLPNTLLIDKDIVNEKGLDLNIKRANLRNSAENGIIIDKDSAKADEDYHNFKNSSAAIVIAQGCLSNCSYCSIRKATGVLKSRHITDIINEIHFYEKNGVCRFTLTAEDTGAYGLDINSNISVLLWEINKSFSNKEIAITGLNPTHILSQLDRFSSEIIESSSNNSIIHLVVPIQSISNSILARMNRKYKNHDIYRIFENIATTNSKIQLHTHIIIGFPGEKENDIEDLLKFIQYFNKVNFKLFPYSDKKGTISYKLNFKNSKEEIYNRLNFINSEINRLKTNAN